MAAHRKLAAILFADIVEYSRQVNADEPAGLKSRRRVEELVRQAAAGHRGRVVKSLGDGLMLEFASAVDAVQCALAIQAEVETGEVPEDPVRLRVGVHAGDVVEEDGDLLGNTVNIAARLEQIAPPGGICVTREIYTQVRPSIRLDCRPVPSESLTRFPEPVEVFEIFPTAPEGAPASTDTESASSVEQAEPARPRKKRKRKKKQEEEEEDDWGWLGCLVLPAFLFGWKFFLAVLLPNMWLVISVLGAGGIAALAVHGILRYGLHDGILEDRWEAVEELPEAIRKPLERARTAYQGIEKLAGGPVWRRRAFPVRRYRDQTRRQLLTLLHRGQQLARIGHVMERHRKQDAMPEHWRDAAELYRRHLDGLEAAAEVFERAEAQFSRAALALSDLTLGPTGVEQPLHEVGLTFDALAEVLGALDTMPALPAVQEAAGSPAEEVHIQVGRRRDE